MLVVAAGHPTGWPTGWCVTEIGSPTRGGHSGRRSLVALLPSAITPTIFKACDEDDAQSVIRLANGWGIVAPEHRRDPADPDARFTRAEIAAMAKNGMRHFSAYAIAHADRQEAGDSWAFCRESWKQFD